MNIQEFENTVKKSLSFNLEKTHKNIGAAVSGGADSLSLLISLSHILKPYNIPLKVISINHNIRSFDESYGDCLFVQSVCNQLKENGFDVSCKIENIPENLVNQIADERKNGVEEAARKLRYEIFENFIQSENLDFLCLAHNQNDQVETLLMRFLQGSSVDAMQGIKNREKYIRPLINISRFEIENYLTLQNQNWRTDSTNSDKKYLRNNIRLNLIPFLDKEFSGWKNAVLAGAKKSEMDAELINNLVNKVEIEIKDDCCFIDYQKFISLEEAIQYRLLLKMANLLNFGSRIPFVFLADFLSSLNCKSDFNKTFENLIFAKEKQYICVKKCIKSQTDLSFFAIIEEEGEFEFPFGKLLIKQENNKIIFVKDNCTCSVDLEMPFIIRNLNLDDLIICKDKSYKKIKDIYSDWKVDEEIRLKIPLIQKMNNNQEIVCIFGEFLGFYNWIVK